MSRSTPTPGDRLAQKKRPGVALPGGISNEMTQVLLDQVASGRLRKRSFLTVSGAAGPTAGLSAATVDQAFAAGDNQAANQAKLKRAYDYIVMGAGASGAIIAGELSKTGAEVLVVEAGGEDAGPTDHQSQHLVL